MSSPENPVETVARFISSWRRTPPPRLFEEIVSASNETHRRPDRFRLVYRKGQIVDYETGQPVKIDRSSYLGQKEGEFFNALTAWLGENDRGTAIWISPSRDSRYPANKIIVYQIESTTDEEKITLNVSIILDTPKSHCLEIASRLNPYFADIHDSEILRNKLFDAGEDFDLVNFLRLISPDKNSTPTPGQETLSYFVNLIYSGADPRFVAYKMQQRDVIGQHAVSCGVAPTFSNFMDHHSMVLNFSEIGKFVRNCGKCGTTINASISKGYRCSNCGGVYEGC